MPTLVHLLKSAAQVLEAAVPLREREEHAPKLRLLLVESHEALVEACFPDARPAPFAEGAEPRVADASSLQVHLWRQVLVKEHLSLQSQGAISDPLPDISRTCVTHEIPADRRVVPAVLAEALE